MDDFGYGRSVTSSLPFASALERVKVLLKEQGFGILCEIDVAQTLRKGTGAEFGPYTILGACNPQLAHRALQVEAQLGLLLPCNVVVQELDGRTVVSAINAQTMLEIIGKAELEAIAGDADARLQRVLDGMAVPLEP